MNNNICFTKFPEIEEDDNPPISRELAKKIQKSGCNSFYEYYMKTKEKDNNNHKNYTTEQISEMYKKRQEVKNDVINYRLYNICKTNKNK